MLGGDNSESDAGEDVADERGAGKRRVKASNNNKMAAQID